MQQTKHLNCINILIFNQLAVSFAIPSQTKPMLKFWNLYSSGEILDYFQVFIFLPHRFCQLSSGHFCIFIRVLNVSRYRSCDKCNEDTTRHILKWYLLYKIVTVNSRITRIGMNLKRARTFYFSSFFAYFTLVQHSIWLKFHNMCTRVSLHLLFETILKINFVTVGISRKRKTITTKTTCNLN